MFIYFFVILLFMDVKVDISKIHEDVNRLLKQFSLKLESFEGEEEFFLFRKDFLREVKYNNKNKDNNKKDEDDIVDVKNDNGFSKKIMFSNAPFSSEDYILAEKKKW